VSSGSIATPTVATRGPVGSPSSSRNVFLHRDTRHPGTHQCGCAPFAARACTRLFVERFCDQHDAISESRLVSGARFFCPDDVAYCNWSWNEAKTVEAVGNSLLSDDHYVGHRPKCEFRAID